MLELRVTVDVLVAFLHLAVALETVVQFMQRGPYPPMAGRVTQALQSVRQRANALARPAQGRHRISPGQRFNKTLQLLHHRRICARSPSSVRPRGGESCPGHRSPMVASSCCPRRMVERANPVMRDTWEIPPCPSASASVAANSRKARSSSVEANRWKRNRILASVVTPRVYTISQYYVKRLFCVRSLAHAPFDY